MSVIAARCSSVLRSSDMFKAGEINHEESEGHEEFGREGALQRSRTAQRAVPTSFVGLKRALFFVMDRTWLQWLILGVLAASGCGQKPAPVVDLASERQRMVHGQLMARGVHGERVVGETAKVTGEEVVLQESG